MRYYSIDTETTGLDRDQDEVLQIGIVMDDTDWWDANDPSHIPVDQLPYIRINIVRERVSGQPFALQMNARLLLLSDMYNKANPTERDLLGRENDCVFCKPDEASVMVRDWILEQEHRLYPGITLVQPTMRSAVTGMQIPAKNSVTINAAGKNFGDFDKQFLRRMPKWDNRVIFRSRSLDPAMLYWDGTSDLPSLTQCLEYAGLNDYVSHDAVDDARQVVQVLRAKFCSKGGRV